VGDRREFDRKVGQLPPIGFFVVLAVIAGLAFVTLLYVACP
jgi:hypothetical protein